MYECLGMQLFLSDRYRLTQNLFSKSKTEKHFSNEALSLKYFKAKQFHLTYFFPLKP